MVMHALAVHNEARSDRPEGKSRNNQSNEHKTNEIS